MASLPQNSESELEMDLPNTAFARLPGNTVSSLLAHGHDDQARDELDRLLAEGIHSGPSIPMTEDLLEDLISKARSALKRRG